MSQSQDNSKPPVPLHLVSPAALTGVAADVETASATAVPTDASLKSLAEISIFDLLGLDLSEEEQAVMLADMLELIWYEFLEEDLPEILGKAGVDKLLNHIENDMGDDPDPVDVGDYITAEVKAAGEDVEVWLMARSIEFKRDFITRHINRLVDSIEIRRANPDLQANLEKIAEVVESLQKALEKEDWQQIVELMGEYDEETANKPEVENLRN